MYLDEGRLGGMARALCQCVHLEPVQLIMLLVKERFKSLSF